MAASLGIPVRLLNYLLFGIVILVLVSSLQAVGCILRVGLLVAPAATIYMFSDSAPVGDGDDTVDAGAGSDSMQGGAGSDTVMFSMSDENLMRWSHYYRLESMA